MGMSSVPELREGTVLAVFLRVAKPGTGLAFTAVVYHERHRCGAVGAVAHEGAVVGEYQQTEILAARFEFGAKRLRHTLGEALDRVDLLLEIVIVSGLVGTFEVNGGEIVIAQQFERSGGFGLVIGIPFARGRGYAHRLKPH